MDYRRKARSPPAHSRRGPTMDPHRASTGSLPSGFDLAGGGSEGRGVGGGGGRADRAREMGMDRMMPGGGFPEGAGRGGDPVGYHYGNPSIHHPPPPHHHHHHHLSHGGTPPTAPPPPHSGQPTPYSTQPPSPTSSSDNLEYYPSAPQHQHHPYAPAPPQQIPPPPPPPPPPASMRGGDGSLGRRNTTSGNKPAIHQYIDQPDYHDYQARSRPVLSQHSPSHRGRSPPGGPFMVIPGSGGAVHHSSSYRPGSSGYSDGSYESGDIRNQGQKGYLISAGADTHRRTNSHDFQLAQLGSSSDRRSGDDVYHLDGPPRRRGREPNRERSLSRPDMRRAMSEDFDYDNPMPPRRIASTSGPVVPTNMSGALVRSRSRSESQGPSSSGGALVRRRAEEDEESAPPSDGTIRLEYAGQAIDIKYTGTNGRPMVGNITINTTARTVSVPEPQSAPPQLQPPPLALPPNVQPVILPAPPPPGGHPQQQALPAPPPRRGPRSERDSDDTDCSHSPPGRRDPHRDAHRDELYQSMANLQIEGPPPQHFQPPQHQQHRQHQQHQQHPQHPQHQQNRAPMHHERGRAPAPAPGPAPRAPSAPPSARSRSRGPSASAPEDPLWTKISRDIVSKRAVLVRGFDFEEVPNAIIIYRVLNEDEIDDLVDLSERIRSGKVEVVRRDPPRRKPSNSSSRRSRSRPARRERPMSIHGYPGPAGPLGPGPSKERPPPMKPAIVQRPPEAPAAPQELDMGMARGPPPPPPPVTVQQTKGGMRDGLREGEIPGTYVGYRMNPKRGGGHGGGVYRTRH
ncbi:hypothetical protein BDD12DRAFT_46990 [Trichophaea hybrida]|nr:hypothetical protein BDD12DRAFT_46990 [Trichophaea hybrida]